MFPGSVGKSDQIDILIKDTIEEHRIIEMITKELMKANQIENVLNKMGWLLEKRIRKEESRLFPQIEQVLNKNELSFLEIKLNQK